MISTKTDWFEFVGEAVISGNLPQSQNTKHWFTSDIGIVFVDSLDNKLCMITNKSKLMIDCEDKVSLGILFNHSYLDIYERLKK